MPAVRGRRSAARSARRGGGARGSRASSGSSRPSRVRDGHVVALARAQERAAVGRHLERHPAVLVAIRLVRRERHGAVDRAVEAGQEARSSPAPGSRCRSRARRRRGRRGGGSRRGVPCGCACRTRYRRRGRRRGRTRRGSRARGRSRSIPGRFASGVDVDDLVFAPACSNANAVSRSQFVPAARSTSTSGVRDAPRLRAPRGRAGSGARVGADGFLGASLAPAFATAFGAGPRRRLLPGLLRLRGAHRATSSCPNGSAPRHAAASRGSRRRRRRGRRRRCGSSVSAPRSRGRPDRRPRPPSPCAARTPRPARARPRRGSASWTR